MFIENHKLLNRKYLGLFIPSLLIIAVMNFVGIVDSVIVGMTLGYEYISVIQVFQPLFIFVNVIVYLLGVGGQILSSTVKSKFKYYEANQYFTIAIVSTILIGIILFIIGLIFHKQIINLLTLNSIHNYSYAYNQCESYFRYLILVLPVSIYLAVLCDYLKVDNYPLLATLAVVIANVLNICLDFILILNFGMGVEGSILATLISEIIGGVIVSYYFISNKRTLKLIPIFKIKFKTFFKELKNICVTGFPGSSSFIYLTICTFVLNSLAMTALGYIGLSVLNLCSNAMLLGSIIIFGCGETSSMMQAVFFPEKDYKSVKYIFALSLKIALITNIIITFIILIYPDVIINLFNFHGDIMVIEFCRYCLRVFSIYFIPGALVFLILFYYQVIQKTAISSVMFLIMRVLGPVGVAFLFYLGGLTFGIWFSYAGGSLIVIALILMLIKVKYHKKNNNKKFLNSILFIDESEEELMTNLTFNKDTTNFEEFKMSLDEYISETPINNNCVKLVESIISIIFNRNDDSMKNIDITLKYYESKFEIIFKDNGINQSITEDDLDLELTNNDIDYTINHINVIGLNLTRLIIK